MLSPYNSNLHFIFHIINSYIIFHTSSRKMEEVKPEMPKLIKPFHTCTMECSMAGEALMIEVKTKED